MPHPTLSSGRRNDSRLLMYAWHAPVPDAHQRASQLCEAVSTWDKYPFQLFCTATERQGKATLGKKCLENTGIYYKRDNLSNCPKGESFCMTHVVLTSCSLGAKELIYSRLGLSAQCWM